MKISEIARLLESIAPVPLQEDYDNAGLLVGDPGCECTGILCTLDVTEAVVEEAVSKKCNCIVAHHPIIFRGLKKLTGGTYVERVVIGAIRKNVAIYAAHTNLDNILLGVNDRIAAQLELTNRSVLGQKAGLLLKLFTFVPADYLDKVRDALFQAGAGNISNYSECSFTQEGKGSFKPGKGTRPFSGEEGKRQYENEVKLEVILPAHAERAVLGALFAAHPYEEVAYDLVRLMNVHQETGSGLIGDIAPVSEGDFLQALAAKFNQPLIRHTAFTGKEIKRVAVCGGAGSFLITNALRAGADVFVTSDVKYHEFFDADGKLLFCDIGHFESEQYTIDLFSEILLQKFPTFAVLKSEVRTNPVNYFAGK